MDVIFIDDSDSDSGRDDISETETLIGDWVDDGIDDRAGDGMDVADKREEGIPVDGMDNDKAYDDKDSDDDEPVYIGTSQRRDEDGGGGGGGGGGSDRKAGNNLGRRLIVSVQIAWGLRDPRYDIEINDIVIITRQRSGFLKFTQHALVRAIHREDPDVRTDSSDPQFTAKGSTKITSVHVHWLVSSAVGGKGELFLLHKGCDTVRSRHITEVIKRSRRVGSNPQPSSSSPSSSSSSSSSSFMVYDPTQLVWRDPLPSRNGVPCDSCLSHSIDKKISQLLLVTDEGGDGFKVGGEVYHIGDLVLVDSKKTGEAWKVGMVVRMPEMEGEWNKEGEEQDKAKGKGKGKGNGNGGDKRPGEEIEWMVPVRELKRVSDLSDAKIDYVSERALYATSDSTPLLVNLIDIVSKAYLTPPNPFLNPFSYPLNSGKYTFTCDYLLPPGRAARRVNLVPLSRPLKTCRTCAIQSAPSPGLEGVKIPSADLYSGGGGSIYGASKHFHVRHAVEMDHACCETLKSNFPNLKVSYSTVGAYITRRQNDRTLAPRPGDLALMIAGPPCQGHSGANRHRSSTDERNAELFVAINEVERVRPDVFVLENVPGFKRDNPGDESIGLGTGRGENGGDREEEGVTSQNHAKEAIKYLLSIGYQIRMALLDCRSYGSPQTRTRLFILSARRGVPLPSFPQPTHANPFAPATIFTVETSTALEWMGVSRVGGGGGAAGGGFYLGIGTPGTGAYPAVTAEDAISDLPTFEYEGIDDPGRRSARTRIPRFDSTAPQVGFIEPVAYASPAKNDYQLACRGREEKVGGHCTARRSEGEIAMIDEAFNSGNDLPGNRRRAKPNGPFYTLLTSSRPGGKGTGCIHWNQRRTFSVAERKRAQGLPDSYFLSGTPDDQDRQLGNAINVHVIEAICRQIKIDVYLPFWKEVQPEIRVEESTAMVWQRWRHAHPID